MNGVMIYVFITMVLFNGASLIIAIDENNKLAIYGFIWSYVAIANWIYLYYL